MYRTLHIVSTNRNALVHKTRIPIQVRPKLDILYAYYTDASEGIVGPIQACLIVLRTLPVQAQFMRLRLTPRRGRFAHRFKCSWGSGALSEDMSENDDTAVVCITGAVLRRRLQ